MLGFVIVTLTHHVDLFICSKFIWVRLLTDLLCPRLEHVASTQWGFVEETRNTVLWGWMSATFHGAQNVSDGSCCVYWGSMCHGCCKHAFQSNHLVLILHNFTFQAAPARPGSLMWCTMPPTTSWWEPRLLWRTASSLWTALLSGSGMRPTIQLPLDARRVPNWYVLHGIWFEPTFAAVCSEIQHVQASVCLSTAFVVCLSSKTIHGLFNLRVCCWNLQTCISKCAATVACSGSLSFSDENLLSVLLLNVSDDF